MKNEKRKTKKMNFLKLSTDQTHDTVDVYIHASYRVIFILLSVDLNQTLFQKTKTLNRCNNRHRHIVDVCVCLKRYLCSPPSFYDSAFPTVARHTLLGVKLDSTASI